jgi:hypothetical protein
VRGIGGPALASAHVQARMARIPCSKRPAARCATSARCSRSVQARSRPTTAASNRCGFARIFRASLSFAVRADATSRQYRPIVSYNTTGWSQELMVPP